MSSGSFSIGAVNQASYHFKNWNGGDGRSSSNNYTMTDIQITNSRATVPPFGYIGGSGFGVAPWASRDTVLLQNELLTAIKGHSFNLGTSLVEAPRTMSMVHSTLAKLGNSIVHVKRGDMDGAARALGVKPKSIWKSLSKDRTIRRYGTNVKKLSPSQKLSEARLSERWLELQYGWKPLISDIYQATLAFTPKPRKSTVVVRRTVKSSNISSSSTVTNTQKNVSTGQYRYTMTESMSVPREVGLTDPLSMAWELIPYSFIVDWFIPIGTFLENVNQIPRLTGTTVFSRGDLRITVQEGKTTLTGARKNGRSLDVTRSVTAGLKIVAPSFRPLEDVLSPTRFLNALALTSQKFKR